MIENTTIKIKKLLGEPFNALEVKVLRGNEEKEGRYCIEDVAYEIKSILKNELEEGEEMEMKIIKK